MMYTDEQLQDLQKIAFDYALYRIGNIEEAQDISSQTISLLLLSFQGKSDARKWIINTAKIYCKKYFERHSSDKKKHSCYREDLIETLKKEKSYETEEDLNKAFKDSFESLSDQELSIIFLYFQRQQNIMEMAAMLNISYDALRKRISRIKQKLKAETFKQLGYIGTKKIVTPQLNNLITKFLQRFKTNLENGSLDKMYYYFSKVDLSNYNQNIQIKTIIGYDIELRDSIYKTWVFYENTKNEPESFSLEFLVDDNNYLKIIKPPEKKKQLVVIDPHSIDGKKLRSLLDKYPEDKTGRPKIPPEELEKIIADFQFRQEADVSEQNKLEQENI